MKNLLCAFALSLSLGCATAVVRPYVGEQQAWPTVNGSIVNMAYELPVFTTLPPEPYDVLAELRVESPLYAQPEARHLKTLAKKAKELGADALVLVDGQIFFSTVYASGKAKDVKSSSAPVTQVNKFNPDSFKQGVSVIAIKWTDKAPENLPSRQPKAKVTPPPPPPESEQPKLNFAPARAVTPPETPAVETPNPTATPSPALTPSPAPAPVEPPAATAPPSTATETNVVAPPKVEPLETPAADPRKAPAETESMQ